MEKVLGIYRHEKFGTIRTILTQDAILFCAKDIAAALGFKAPKEVVKYHCTHIQKHSHYSANHEQRMCVMNFIDLDSVFALMERCKCDIAEPLKSWLLSAVIPDILHRTSVKHKAPEQQEDAEYLIHLQDYLRHIDEKLMCYIMVRELAEAIRKLPLRAETYNIKSLAEKCAKTSNNLWDSWGIPESYLSSGNTNELTELIESELLSPQDAGFCDSVDANKATGAMSENTKKQNAKAPNEKVKDANLLLPPTVQDLHNALTVLSTMLERAFRTR